MMGKSQGVRPKFLNLFQIGLPLTGVVSIFHRISGVFLILAIPLWLYWLDISLMGPAAYHYAQMWLHTYLGMALAGYTLACLFYHLIAGTRFLLIDLGMPMDKTRAHSSAMAVLAATLAIMVLILVRAL